MSDWEVKGLVGFKLRKQNVVLTQQVHYRNSEETERKSGFRMTDERRNYILPLVLGLLHSWDQLSEI